MGGCVSLSRCVPEDNHRSSALPTATVISISGELRCYDVPTTVRRVLDTESTPSFMCSSDGLLYEEFIPALNPDDDLIPDQIYFVLPKSKLRHRLTASDMAAMAVRASLALKNDQSNKGSSRGPHHSRRRNNRSAQISPVSPGDSYNDVTIGSGGMMKKMSFDDNTVAVRPVYSRSGSVRKLQRTSSKRVKMAVRSFRMRLSTIYEGSVL